MLLALFNVSMLVGADVSKEEMFVRALRTAPASFRLRVALFVKLSRTTVWMSAVTLFYALNSTLMLMLFFSCVCALCARLELLPSQRFLEQPYRVCVCAVNLNIFVHALNFCVGAVF